MATRASILSAGPLSLVSANDPGLLGNLYQQVSAERSIHCIHCTKKLMCMSEPALCMRYFIQFNGANSIVQSLRVLFEYYQNGSFLNHKLFSFWAFWSPDLFPFVNAASHGVLGKQQEIRSNIFSQPCYTLCAFHTCLPPYSALNTRASLCSPCFVF